MFFHWTKTPWRTFYLYSEALSFPAVVVVDLLDSGLHFTWSGELTDPQFISFFISNVMQVFIIVQLSNLSLAKEGTQNVELFTFCWSSILWICTQHLCCYFDCVLVSCLFVFVVSFRLQATVLFEVAGGGEVATSLQGVFMSLSAPPSC